MQRFTDLKVWQRSHALVLQVYRVTKDFPADERFCLTSQLRRAASSVPSNIAEGSKRKSAAEYAHHLNIAESEAAQTEYHLILSRDLGYLAADKADAMTTEAAEIARMLYALRAKVEQGKA